MINAFFENFLLSRPKNKIRVEHLYRKFWCSRSTVYIQFLLGTLICLEPFILVGNGMDVAVAFGPPVAGLAFEKSLFEHY